MGGARHPRFEREIILVPFFLFSPLIILFSFFLVFHQNAPDSSRKRERERKAPDSVCNFLRRKKNWSKYIQQTPATARVQTPKTRRHEMAEPSAPAAAATAGQTDAEREEALDRMLTRLALADDARLAPLLARVLPYAITSLASSAAPVRKLVRTPYRSIRCQLAAGSSSDAVLKLMSAGL
jgi:hypothetical protein